MLVGNWNIRSCHQQAVLISRCAQEMGFNTALVHKTQPYPISSRCIYYEPIHWEAWFHFIWRQEPRKIYYATIEGELNLHAQMAQTSRSFRVWAVSSYVKELLERVKMHVAGVCWHAIDFALLDSIRRQVQREPGPLRMVYIGDIQPRKGIHLLAEAVRMLWRERPDGWELRLYTNGHLENGRLYWIGPDGVDKRVYDFSGIPNVRITLTGMGWDHAKLMREVAKCDLYVQPSLGEGFGVPLLEAWGLGLPTICVRAPPFTEFVPDEVNFWLDWVDTDYYQWHTWQRQILHLWDPRQWVEQILRILEHPHLLEHKRSCTVQTAQKFDYTQIYPRLIEEVR